MTWKLRCFLLRCAGARVTLECFPLLNHIYSSDPIKTFKEFFGNPD